MIRTGVILTPEQTSSLVDSVFAALSRAAEGGHDHASDGMDRMEVANSLLDYDSDINDLWTSLEEEYQDDPVDVLTVLQLIVASQVDRWREQRSLGLTPSPDIAS